MQWPFGRSHALCIMRNTVKLRLDPVVAFIMFFFEIKYHKKNIFFLRCFFETTLCVSLTNPEIMYSLGTPMAGLIKKSMAFSTDAPLMGVALSGSQNRKCRKRGKSNLGSNCKREGS